MKNLTVRAILLLLFIACANLQCDSSGSNYNADPECGTHNGNKLYLGPQGGCYYINSNGNKTYVDRSECHC